MRKGASSASMPYISYERCSTVTSDRRQSCTALPSVRASRASSTSLPYISYERCRYGAIRLHAIVPDVFTNSAALIVCKRGASSVSRPYISRERGRAIVPDEITYRAALRACEKESAASAGLTSLTSDAAPSRRV